MMRIRLPLVLTVAVFLTVTVLLASDRSRRARQETAVTHDIPPNAIMVPLPDIQQPDDYSCGAAALMSVASYFGAGPEDLDAMKKALGTNARTGTSVYSIEKYASKTLELDVKLVEDDFTKDDLRKALAAGHPVICSIQAYDDAQTYDVPPGDCRQLKYNKNGHFVVAIGYDDDDYFYFMDPSLTGRRGFLHWKDLDKRWHDNEGTTRKPEPHCHLAIILGPGKHKAAYLSRARKID